MSTNRPPSCENPFNNYKPAGSRPKRNGYAPGDYYARCNTCDCIFIGDKRAYECADCAYAGSNRPPSCDLPPEFYKPHLKPCPLCAAKAVRSNFQAVVKCTRQGCNVIGPENDPHGHKWNSIPRRSEVLELIRLVDGYFAGKTDLLDLRICAGKLRKEMGE